MEHILVYGNTGPEQNELSKHFLGKSLKMEFIEVGLDCLVATMPVGERTKQSFELLHGRASVALSKQG